MRRIKNALFTVSGFLYPFRLFLRSDFSLQRFGFAVCHRGFSLLIARTEPSGRIIKELQQYE
jgi:hypothetical protein